MEGVSNDVIVTNWSQNFYAPNLVLQDGYTNINAGWIPLYVVEHYGTTNLTAYPPSQIYTFSRYVFGSQSTIDYPAGAITVPSSSDVIGAELCWWEGRGEDAITNLRTRIAPFSARIWAPDTEVDFNYFNQRFQQTDAILSQLLNKRIEQPYNFEGEIVNPNATIPSGYYGNLTGNGTFGWQTGTCAIDIMTNGFVFTLDSGNGNPLTYGGVIEGSGRVTLKAAPAWSPYASVPIILSGGLPNSYSGVTTLMQGVVELAKPQGITAIPGNLVMENQGANDELRWAASEQIANSADLTVLSTAGTLNLNDFQETIHNLRMVRGAVIKTGTANGGTLTVNHFWYGDKGFQAGTYTAANTPCPCVTGTGRLIVLQSTMRIMPLGDSMTYIASSYRGLLFTKLSQAGYPIDMVGTLSNPAEGGTDPDHEGHDGAVIGPGEPNEWGDDPATGYKNNLYDLAPTFMSQNPDVILLLIGINDYTNYRSAAGKPVSYDANTQSPPKLAGLIDRILACKPDVNILVASLLPVATERSETYNVGPFNAAIPDIVAKRATAGKHVYFVDMNAQAGIDPNDPKQLYDGIHPTLKGSQKIAAVWFDHLTPILNRISNQG